MHKIELNKIKVRKVSPSHSRTKVHKNKKKYKRSEASWKDLL